ncbi:metal ABC transporter ATP-binding protein [Calditerricola satsumensis]|uniref:metal ABC transporter ATP-binding protein n=1 Tax=Calditerricola satsumensis TaxID=373054 RepID=UPI00166E15B5|nr:metal ABC transporter ATP-binding protein [Calditerricola satsumensis]
MNAGKPVVDVQNVSFSYGDRLVLEDVNLTVERGAFVGLVGPNGGGKSTLIKLILGLLKPDRGEIRLFGQPLERFRAWTKIGYVSQKANSFNSGFPATVFEVVAMGLFGKMGLFKWMGKREKEKVYQTLEWVGMAEYARQPIGKLSGGQQQRVFIARALVADPELLILDEPTVGVDEQSVAQFFALLASMRRELGLTLLLVSHDIGAITSMVDRVACLNKRLHFHGDSREFAAHRDEILHRLYGHEVRVLEHNHGRAQPTRS